MTIETVLVKRGALHRGEVGFFPSNPVSEDDVRLAKMGEEIVCSFYSPRNLQQLRFLWGLAYKLSQASDRYLDKDEAMADLKLRAGFTRVIYDDKTKKLELAPRSLKRITYEHMRSLTEKILDIVCEDILPHMKKSQLRKEVENMVGVTEEK